MDDPEFDAHFDLHLTPLEYKVLHTLWAARGRALSPDNIIRLVYHGDEIPSSDTITVYICHLRRKLHNTTWRIEKPAGLGYRLVAA